MAFGFQPAGLFGRRRKPMTGLPGPISGFGGGTFNTDGTQATPVDRYPDEPMGAPQEAMQAAPKPGLFGKIAGAAGNIGAILDDEPSPQEVERDRQRFLEQQAMRKRDSDWADFQRQFDYKQAHEKPTGDEYTYFEDNAGNRWRQNKATGAVDSSPAFIDRTPKEFVADGVRYSIPNPYSTGAAPSQGNAGAIPRVTDEASYNALPVGSQFYDDEGKLRTKQGGPGATPGNFPGSTFSDAFADLGL